MNSIKILKSLLVAEIRSNHPSFKLLDDYIRALKDALARDRQLSVADATVREQDPNGVTGHFVGQNAYAAGAVDVEAEEENYGHMNMNQATQRETRQDQLLATMGQMAARSGPDPLTAILAALPNLERLYGSEWPRVSERIRTKVDRRLTERTPPINPDTTIEPENGTR